MGDTIVGKVAKVLNDREVVLNRGRLDGVKEGDYVGIVDAQEFGIKDPDSDRDLGDIVRFKVALRVTQISDRLSIASTYKVSRVNVGGNFNYGALKAFQAPEWVERVERLTYEENSILPISPEESRIQVSDEFWVVEKEVADSGFAL